MGSLVVSWLFCLQPDSGYGHIMTYGDAWTWLVCVVALARIRPGAWTLWEATEDERAELTTMMNLWHALQTPLRSSPP